MHFMSCWIVFGYRELHDLFFLRYRYFPSCCRLKFVYDMSCWFILRYLWTVGSHWGVHCGQIRCRVIQCVHQLSGRELLVFISLELCIMRCRHIPSVSRLELLFGLHCGILLRHFGTVGSDWWLRSREIFSCLSECLLVLCDGYFQFSSNFIKLYELLCWHFRCVGWTECMHFLLHWNLLRCSRICLLVLPRR